MASRALSLIEAVAARRPRSPRREANIGTRERAGSALTGAALLAWGISQRSLGGAVAGVVGGALLYRGARGRSRLYEVVGISTAASTGFVERAVTVRCSPEEVSAFCHDVQNLPRFLPGVVSVRNPSPGRLSWITSSGSWDAVIEADTSGEIFAWCGADGPSGGLTFRLAPGGRGTEVRLRLEDVAADDVEKALRTLKQLVEAGERPTTEGQPAGRGSR